ncbi:MAG: cation-translocating P-type ATPase, partial [Mycolicibacter sinensis]
AGAVLAGVPKGAYLGRQAFGAVLGRGLADAGQLVLDPGALRRLDRVKVIVIDGAALRGDARAVLHARGDVPGWDEDRVYEVADALLHGEQAPEPDPDELPATGARLRWVRAQPSAAPVQGLERADLVVDGEVVGRVKVGWEVDPFAVPLLQTAHRTGNRVVLRHVAGTQELTASVAASYPPGTPLLKLVRELRADRGPVLLITALHRDFASTDTLAALAIADVGVALDDPQAATPWSADIITGTDLAAAVRILSALPVAKRASESAVRLAQGGSTLAGLLLVAGDSRGTPGPLALRRWLDPVNAAGAAALVAGSLSARKVLNQPDPTPQPLTAWHALDPEIVYSRLAGSARPLAAEIGPPTWRRTLEDFADHPVLAPLRAPATRVGKLLAATREELADPLTPILAVGAAASAIFGSNIDALLVAGVMAANALVGGTQRLRAEAAIAELFAEQDALARRVVLPPVATTQRRLDTARNGRRTVTLRAKSLRPGDVIDLAASDVVPADARLLTAEDLEVDESLLTGESLPVDKQVDPVAVGDPERASMLFEGSTIVAGHARAIVVATG